MARRVVILMRDGVLVILSARVGEFERLPGDIRMLRNPRQLLRDVCFGESTRSTQPAATALRGIESYLAESSCAKVIPPSALIASNPSVPSLAVPDSTTPMARSRWSCASDSKKESIGRCGVRVFGRG